MAKTIEFDLYIDGTFKEKTTRPLTKMGVCIEGKFYDVKDGKVNISVMDEYPWDPVPDPELEQLLGWYCTNRNKICNTLNLENIWVTEKGIMAKRKTTKQLQTTAALLAMMGTCLGS